ncbi:Glyco_hydro_35 domain-containing protein/Gal_Lectin domain-containing protein [Cephalotus follicularis]|uniref:Beta-galactosidase n=1 Tax=Cephalotus follicularis TaxID=3775 RepID=A0A1Q3B542_CEPFO|nr:Glyco_hydro_35 domain-containing protein/Gal_Lectin domain-containing protein [Cephalotus follicularis]
MKVTTRQVLLIGLVSLLVSSTIAKQGNKTQGVVYDGRSLIINGKRELLFSGSIHYTRSTPDMWPDILSKAKHGGLNVIQTYVFWNVHEPIQGQFYFEGQYDLVKFIRMVAEHGMYVTLRVGPFIQAEWNHGGLPYWLREVPGIIFRSDNAPFKYHMKKFVKMIMDKMKEEKLFAPQGGPIILAQIENEYNSIQLAYKELGTRYVQWAGNMAIGLKTGVPWVMCKQKDAPDPVINTCNGRHCGDTFTGPNKAYKPSIWTENWTAQYRVFGDPPSQRSAEDISFSVARFFAKNGTLANYYMYHGGTNFGRTSSAFTTTRYYDEAPLDEYGKCLQRNPKWGHLKDLHKALNLCKKPLLWGNPSVERISADLEARVYEKVESKICAAFLTNNNTKMAQTMKFRGQEYYLPARSISILPDCETVVYNTQTIVAQHSARNYVKSETANKKLNWKMYQEAIPTPEQLKLKAKNPLELYGLTKDTTDYAWFISSIELDRNDLPFRKDILPVIRVQSLGHAMLAFINGEYVGTAHGSHDEKSFVFQTSIKLKTGRNQIAFLGILVGLPDSGAYMEHRFAGPRAVTILGLNTGTLDLTNIGWSHQIGLTGEKVPALYTSEGSQKFEWTKVNGVVGAALVWCKATFMTPEGNDPVVVSMNGMKKGMVWINGKSIGRYWMSFLSPLGQPSQSEYHIPRSYLKPKKNLIVVLEEDSGSNPDKIEIQTVNRDTICSVITEFFPAHVRSWARENNKIRPVVDDVKPAAHLTCPNFKQIVAVEFASFGDPYGACGNFALGNCTSPLSKDVVEKNCLGKNSCAVPLDREAYNKGKDGCPDIQKTLAIQVKCEKKKH